MVTYLQKHERLSAEERKQQLIEVAIDLFSKKGFGGTTTKEIAAAAGVNEAIIFRHFATKQQLYAAILDSKMREPQIQAGLAEICALMEGNDDEAVFGWLVRGIIGKYCQDQRFERLMLYAALEGHEIAVMHHNQVSPFLDALHKYIQRRQREGALIECDPFLVITALVSPAKQYATGKYLFCWNKTEQDDERVAATLTKVLLDGFRAQKTQATTKRKKK